MDYALEVKNLSKNYREFSLNNISFSLPKGSIMGLIGENGAGKSTTIKLIMNLIRKDQGEIRIFGQKNDTLSVEGKEEIGLVLDECCFPEALTPMNLNKIMKTLYRNWQQQIFLDYLDRFQLPQKAAIKTFSRGMKMKLSIAVALSHKAKLLILDEATSGLDPFVRDEILDFFLDFLQDESKSILLSSHIISDLEKICDYITFLHKGKLLFSSEKDLLKDQHAILKCSEEDLAQIDPNAVKCFRKNQFGVEALVSKYRMPAGFELENATLEDIMIYYGKEQSA